MIGQTITHYRITDRIGAGGMGEVYRATDTVLKREVALKFLPEELARDEVARRRFLREAQSAAALDHPFICHIHEIGEADGKDFIAMEYVEGRTLRDRLAPGPLAIAECLKIALEIAEALEKAHQNRIVHRDLKPSNIMLTPDGHAKVMDFGLAKRVAREEENSEEATLTGLTREGSTVGTVPYMSPEQLKGEEVDTRSDIFSFGIILYEMLAGVHPFRKPEGIETAGAILHNEPAPPARYREGVSEVLGHMLRKMLAKDPGDRYQSVHEVQTNLRMVSGESVPPDRDEEPRPALRRSKKSVVLLSVLSVVVLAGCILLWVRQAEEPPAVTVEGKADSGKVTVAQSEPTPGIADHASRIPSERSADPEPASPEPGRGVEGDPASRRSVAQTLSPSKGIAHPASRDRSIAVLPFANRSNLEEDLFFTDGIHDDLLTRISRIPGIRTISRTSVMRYRNPVQNMRTIGEELGVSHILEGGVQRAGDRIRINVQLIDTLADAHLWAETYTKVLTAGNVFEIQNEISRAIVDILRVILSPEDRERMDRLPTENLVALESYFKGKVGFFLYTLQGAEEAVVHFGKAVELDPGFASAQAMLGRSLLRKFFYAKAHSDDQPVIEAESHILRAVELDDSLSEAYAALGGCLSFSFRSVG